MTINKNKAVLPLFSLTLFLSAALMFAVQPMVGKMLLPLVGGSTAGWIVAMAFFQISLLAGYLLAHLFSRLTPRQHAACLVAALLAGTLFLPIHLGTTESINGYTGVFRLLAIYVAIPFIALAMTSSTIQRLFTTTGHASSKDPYFLYAASNLGSFAGLFLYPLIVEYFWGLDQQGRYWLWGYAALIAAVLLCLFHASGQTSIKKKQADAASIPWRRQAEWVGLAFIPSSLMLGVTAHISTDIFSAPMIWVWPLGLYLLTFVAAFAKKPPVHFKTICSLHTIAVALPFFLMLMYYSPLQVSWRGAGLHLACFTITALMCHLRLAQDRPDSEWHLTRFYLMISIGGALGGILNAFIAPNVLNSPIEYPVVLLLSCLANPDFKKKIAAQNKRALIAAGALTLIYTGYACLMHDKILGYKLSAITHAGLIADAFLGGIVLLFSLHIRGLFWGAAFLLFSATIFLPKNILLTERNFYGVVRVFDRITEIDQKLRPVRFMYHGTTTHGIQILDPAYEKTTTSYYVSPSSPISHVFSFYRPKEVGAVGLGSGTINCFTSPRRSFSFIEIDPAVARIARDYFTYLSACKNKEPAKIIIGDGRLELQKMQDKKFDLIVMDAFSSDSIPTHLLTTEAFRLYLERLNPRGMIVVNVSNRYFDLVPLLASTAKTLEVNLRFMADPADRGTPYAFSSVWAILAPKDVNLRPLDRQGWQSGSTLKPVRPWTDDYTNLLSALRF